MLVPIVSNGISSNLLKIGTKRRRTKLDVKLEKEQKKQESEVIAKKLAQIDELRAEVCWPPPTKALLSAVRTQAHHDASTGIESTIRTRSRSI